MERVERAAAKAQRDLVTAGENVTAWKVSQAALVSLQVDSWGSLGFQLQDVPLLRQLLATEGKINAFIHCFIGAQRITSLYDLEVAICKNEGIERFEELGLGPLSRHPLAQHYFLIPSNSVEIFKISSEDIIACLRSLLNKSNKRTVSAEELLGFIADQKSVSVKEKLGIRIQSLGWHVSFIRQAKKSEKTILTKSLEGNKRNGEESDSTEIAPSACTHAEKQMLHKRFDYMSDRVKQFSTLCNLSSGKHIHFNYSSNDECDDSDENVVGENINSGPHPNSSYDNTSGQSCPYPSAAEEMKRLGLKFDTGEKETPLKDKLMDVWGRSSGRSKSSSKKRKRKHQEKRQEKHDDTMNKFLRKEEAIDCSKKLRNVTLPDGYTENFVATWKEACRVHSAAEVLDMMINFYMASTTEKARGKFRKIFSSFPGVGILNVAVTSIKRGLSDSLYDTVQIFGDHCSAPSAEIIEINPSIKVDSISKITKHIDERGYRVTVDDIIRNVAEFFRLDVVIASERELSSGKLFKALKRFCDCETWLAAHFSVKEFSSLGHGDFLNFLEKHASLLPNELCSFLNWKSPEPSRVEVSMLQHQLQILLSQAESNLIDERDISKSDISLVLRKQFPTVSFHIAGDEPEKCFLDLFKRQKDCNNSSSIVYSISLLGKFSTADFLAFQEKLPSEDTATESRTGRKIYSHGNVSSKDAIDSLLKVPMLSDLLSWSHWDVLYAPSLGPLSDWLLNEDIKELLCIATVDGKFIRIDQSATVDDFLDAMVQSSPFKVALKLLSLLSLYGGVSNAPVSLLKCYVQRAVDVIIRNSTSSAELGSREALTDTNAWQGQASRGDVSNVGTRSVDSHFESISMGNVLSGINEAVVNISRFILECLDYLPIEFRNFGSDILVSGLRSVAKDAHSVILRECSRINQRLMLHDIGLSLGIADWIDDFREFSSKTSVDLFIFSTTLPKTSLCSGCDGTSIHTYTSEKPLSNYHNKFVSIAADASETDVCVLNDGDNVRENGSILADGGPGKRQDFSAAVGEDSVMADSVVQDATSIVESIRREEFGLDPNLNYSDSCMLKRQHARLGRALHCLSQELYSQDSHLLLELVQNADDNNYPENVDPTLVFILQEAGIVVLNNEHGFSAENIRALCDIGNSTKKGSKAGYIGHKGIGFKSVFRVTDAPEIHSNGFHVKFDITEGQIGFVLPTVIPSCNVDTFRRLVSGERYSSNDTQWNTCIVLPFRSKIIEGTGMTSIISMFSDLHPSLLLFLHRLRSIKFMNMLNNTFVDMRREILGNGIVKVCHGQETMTWLVISKKLPANLIRSDVKSTEIAVAFTLEECESGEYKPHISQQPVFAFLPLRNYGLKFILQGDFVLPSSREEVDGNSAWNQWLLSEFPALFVNAEQSFCSLPCFHKYPGKAVTIYLSFVPVGGEVHGFFSYLPQMIISKLRMSNCLLLDGPDLTWVLPCRVLRGWNEQARMLLSDSLLQKHLGLGYLSKDIELSDALAKALGIQDYGPKVLIDIISSVCCSKDGIMSLGLDWLSAWLGVLHCALSTNSGHHSLHVRFEHDLIDSLRKIQFIPLSDGSYTSVVDGPIWLPCDASSVGIEGKYSATEFPSLYSKLRTVNPLLLSEATNNMYNIEEVKRDNLVHMLCKIGVQQLSAHEVIKSQILMALSNDKYMDEHKNLMIEYLSFILLHFQYDCTRCCSEKKEIISELRKSPVLLTNCGYKCPIEEPVHFGKEYMNPVDTDKFSCTMDYRWLEVDAVYLKHPSIQSLSLGVQKWRNFLQELGVTDFVQVSCTRKSSSDNLCSFSGDMTPVGDLAFVASFIDDWESSELFSFLSTFSSNKCREKCIYLLEVLDKMWDDIYNAYSRSFIVSKTNENKRTIESTFLKSLRHFKWIASSTDHDLHQSKDLFHDCVEVRSILGNLAPYAVPQVTSKLLLKDIGFKTEVSVDDALEILHFWNKSEAPCRTSILQMSKFYTFISDGLIRSKVKITEEFISSSFIFVPFLSTSRHNDSVSGIFLSPNELYWHDPTGCVDKTKELVFLCSSTEGNSSVPCKALATIYPGLYDFFVNVCGVPKSPPSGSYFQILLELSSIAPPSQAAHAVFQVFVKWADDLKSGLVNPGEILELKENLLKLENTVLPTLQDKWVSLHSSFGLICWPDDDELKEQFKHSDSIDFLHFGELEKEDHDKLSGTIATLVHDIGVPALSEVVSREAIFYGTHDNREKASVINWILPYVQRYIYKLYPDIYLGLKQLGFEKLNQLQVIVVDKLFYKNCLRGRGSTSKKRFECSCLLQGSTLYTTLTADTHSIFLELSRLFFNGSTELHFANFLHMVTTMAESGSTSEQTEFFILNSQKIPMLPDEEPLWCFSPITEPPVAEDSQPSLASMSVNQNSQTAEKQPGPNTNWPPTGWRTAPGMSYAKANYHLTKPWEPPSMHREKGSTRPLDALPVTDDLPISVEIGTEWIIEEGATAASTIALQDSVLTNNQFGMEPVNVADGLAKTTSAPNTELGDSALVPAPQRERLCYDTNDEQQSWKTGRVGEMIVYKYFVDKLGSGNVRWVNEGAETGLPYDLITGVEESSREYIEVKATRYANKDWFEISTREWQFAVERGDSYSIAHVVVGAKKASISVLRNPSRLCQQKSLHLALLMSRHVK